MSSRTGSRAAGRVDAGWSVLAPSVAKPPRVSLGSIVRIFRNFDRQKISRDGSRVVTDRKPYRANHFQSAKDVLETNSILATGSAAERASSTLWSSRHLSLAVLIPCFNEAATIEAAVRDFRSALPVAAIYL